MAESLSVPGCRHIASVLGFRVLGFTVLGCTVLRFRVWGLGA